MTWAWLLLPLGPGGTTGTAQNISADGHVAVGLVDKPPDTNSRWACTWVDGAGPNFLGLASSSEADAVNHDGSVIVGTTSTGQPFRWVSGSVTSFGDTRDIIRTMTPDASRTVGSTRISSTHEQACFWNAAGTPTLLGFLPGHDQSRALGISEDGQWIVGLSQLTGVADTMRAFRWSAATGMINLGMPTPPPTPHDTWGFGVSPDGAIVVGDVVVGGNAAFRWDTGLGMIYLPTLVENASSTTVYISGDGQWIVGYQQDPNFTITGYTLCWWPTADRTDPGVVPSPLRFDPNDPDSGIDYTYATGVSHDGMVMVGYVVRSNPLPWLYDRRGVDYPPPPPPIGLTVDNVRADGNAPPAPPPVLPGCGISLEWSDTRGKSFGSPVLQQFGATGEYRKMLLWRRLGYAYDRVFRITWSCNAPTALQGAWIEADPEASGKKG